MPQRQFWTNEWPTKITFALAVKPDDPEADPSGTVTVFNQSGQRMLTRTSTIPAGFAAWAFADACRAGMEGWELGGPEDAERAFTRVLAQWRRDARVINRQGS